MPKALPGFGYKAKLPLEELQGLDQAAGNPQSLTPALHDELKGEGLRRGRLDDGVGRRFVGMPEYRKERHAVAMIDCIIAPYAACNVAAVKPEQLVELMARKIQGPLLGPIIREGQYRRAFPAHFHPSSLALSRSVHDFLHRVQRSDIVSQGVSGRVWPVCFRASERLSSSVVEIWAERRL